jgi:hypothetical protein
VDLNIHYVFAQDSKENTRVIMDKHKRTSNPRVDNIDEEQILLEELLLDHRD